MTFIGLPLPCPFPLPFQGAVLLLLGLVLAPVIYHVLGGMRNHGLDLRPRALVAGAVTLLCLLGLSRTIGPRAEAATQQGGNGWLGFILLPYAALALAIPLVLLLRWLGPSLERWWRDWQHRSKRLPKPGWQDGSHRNQPKGQSPTQR